MPRLKASYKGSDQQHQDDEKAINGIICKIGKDGRRRYFKDGKRVVKPSQGAHLIKPLNELIFK